MTRWLISDQTPPQVLNAARPQVWYGASQVSPEEGVSAPAPLPGEGTAAGTLLGTETNGLAFSASDDSMVIRDTVTPANVYVGSPAAKFGSVRISPAMQYGSGGLLEWGPENLCLNSQDFTAWTPNAATVTANSIAAPDGTVTADLITATGTSTCQVYQPAGAASHVTVYTWSCWLKKGTANWAYMSAHISGDTHYSWFDMTLGVIGTNTAGNTSTMTAVGDGWFLCTITRQGLGSGGYSVVGLSSIDNNLGAVNGSTLYAWGAGLNKGAAPSLYLPTTSSEVYGLRRDYDARVAGPKYLIEEQRTNIALNSQDLTAWSDGGASATANTMVAPDGTTTADTVTLTASGGYRYGTIGIGALSAGVAYTWSCFVKKGSADWAFIGAYNNNVIYYSWFNVNTGVVGTNTAGNTSTITALPNGWYRCTVTRTAVAGNCLTLIGCCDGDNSGVGTIGKYFYPWGYTVEAGAFASSYIPTTSAAVTREADLPSMLTSAMPYSATAGTLYHKFARMTEISGIRYAMSWLNDGSGNEAIGGWAYDSGNLNIGVVHSGGYQAQFTTPAAAAFTNTEVALAWALNDSRAAKDGTLLGVDDTVVSLSTAADRWSIGSLIGANIMNGWYTDGMYVKRRMTNAELQTVTTP